MQLKTPSSFRLYSFKSTLIFLVSPRFQIACVFRNKLDNDLDEKCVPELLFKLLIFLHSPKTDLIFRLPLVLIIDRTSFKSALQFINATSKIRYHITYSLNKALASAKNNRLHNLNIQGTLSQFPPLITSSKADISPTI